jgi:hypothetical protein
MIQVHKLVCENNWQLLGLCYNINFISGNIILDVKISQQETPLFVTEWISM